MSAICSLWKLRSNAYLFQIAQGKSFDYMLINKVVHIKNWLWIMFGETWIPVKGLLSSLLLSNMLRNFWKYEYIVYKPYFDIGKSSAIAGWFSTFRNVQVILRNFLQVIFKSVCYLSLELGRFQSNFDDLWNTSDNPQQFAWVLVLTLNTL